MNATGNNSTGDDDGNLYGLPQDADYRNPGPLRLA
eukprot:CAMPEP_0171711340 /NCGR_PEP_ID=MMETSP0991-20121206/16506_1 /TAXON_ID=483369 /ORGANISM="non described non described, Strain CCMP2098" /LENGTH=34 /DNA_ID= /DNA_START= /DNA_END= /DNA_ORIENTATION=